MRLHHATCLPLVNIETEMSLFPREMLLYYSIAQSETHLPLALKHSQYLSYAVLESSHAHTDRDRRQIIISLSVSHFVLAVFMIAEHHTAVSQMTDKVGNCPEIIFPKFIISAV